MSRGGRTGLRRWAADLVMGARFAVSGGREGWARTVLTAVGVGLGVAVLLVAASVPHIMAASDARSDARMGVGSSAEEPPTEHSVLMAHTDTVYHGQGIRGRLLQAEGDAPIRPPGVRRLPAPDTMLVSPSLLRLLQSDDGTLLRRRLPYRIGGLVGAAGLTGPHELVYYAGSDTLNLHDARWTDRISHFGSVHHDRSPDPALVLLAVAACVVLLLPVGAFVAAAVRFDGERRDRRLAALRLLGADARTTRLVAAGEAAASAMFGLVVGVAVFLPLKWSATHISVAGVSAFPFDVRPAPALVVLIALGVPACAVGASLLTLRGVVIEPLGVLRQSVPSTRRLWWRLAPMAAGLALLAPAIGGVREENPAARTYLNAAGMVLVLVGVTAVLPWLVEAVVGRVRGGSVTLQLAVRQLQLDSGTAGRAVSGITVAVAGAIALQLLFGAVETQQIRSTGQEPSRAQMVLSTTAEDGTGARETAAALHATHGVIASTAVTSAFAGTGNDRDTHVQVAGCPALRELAHVGTCHDGDVFLVRGSRNGTPPKPGEQLDLSGPGRAADQWTVPQDARTAPGRTSPLGARAFGVFATPSALDAARLRHADVQVFVRLDPDVSDAEEYVRNTAAAVGPGMFVMRLHDSRLTHQFTVIEQSLYAGAAGVLLLIGASMVVSTLEQLRERRRLLSVLVAFGTRRGTLARSVLWQTAVPVVLGMVLATVTGIGLGAVLVSMTGRPLHVDWAVPATSAGLGAGLIALVTLLSMPVLWRLMRPEGLRTE